MIVYLDSSALVKLYVNEVGSDLTRGLLASASVVAASTVAYPETRAAFARLAREGLLGGTELQTIRELLRADWQAMLVVPVSPALALDAGELAERRGLRGADAIHLATVLELRRNQHRPLTFACWDAHLGSAAATEGLRVVGIEPGN